MIPYGRQDISNEDIQSVIEVLKSDFLTQGPVIEKFESAICQAVDAPYCVAVSSATAGLHIGFMALGVGPGDEVWTSPNTFVATSNAALYCGGKPRFIDIERTTFNLDMTALETALKLAAKPPKVVAPVHFGGASCDMRKLKSLADQYGFKILEDASHAIGTDYEGIPVGSCQYSDITVFSFHPVKIVTTAEGGAVLTKDKKTFAALQRLRTHGITRDPAMMTVPPAGPWYYEQQELGFNYRITDIQAALGISQLKRLEQFVERRNQIVELYKKELKDLPLQLQTVKHGRSAYHLMVVVLTDPKHRERHHEILREMRERGIGVNLHYIPVYNQPYYKNHLLGQDSCPTMDWYYGGAMTIPLFPTMRDEDVLTVSEVLKSILSRKD